MTGSLRGILCGALVFLVIFGPSGRTVSAREIGPDAFGYTAADAPFSFEDLSGSGTRVLARTDNGVASAPLPFTFTFYGVDYTSLSWSTNGLITFGGMNSDPLNVSFSTAAPTGDRPSIAVLWDDWQFVQGGADASYYEVRGAVGSRRFMVQWNLIFEAPSSPSNAIFQAVVYEGSNDILLRLIDYDTATATSFGASATVGIRDAGGHLNGRNLEWSFNSPIIWRGGEAIRFFAPTDETPPAITITSPANGAVLGSDMVVVSASLVDESPSTVSSSPAGVSASLPAGGGSVSGSVALVEGSNTIVLSATDESGNVGGTSVTVVRDMTSPTLIVESPAQGSVLGATPGAFVVDVRDATETVLTVGTDSQIVPAGGGLVTMNVDLVEGLNTVEITAVDAAGNAAAEVLMIVLDLSAPLVTIDSPADGASFGPGESPISLVATVNDATATQVISMPDGVAASVPAGGGVVVGAISLAEGSNRITVMASDESGRSGTASIVVLLDTNAPTVTLDSPPAGLPLRGMVDLAATASDPTPGSGVVRLEVFLDGAVVASFSAPPYESMLDTSLFEDGPHALTAVVLDGVGNASTSRVPIVIDNTPPTVEFVSPLDGAVMAGLFPFSVSSSDALSGLASVQVLAGGSAPSMDPSTAFDPAVRSVVLDGEVDSTGRPDGMLLLTATAVDAAGNETFATISVIVDNTPPEAITITPEEGSVVSGDVEITVDAAGLAGGVLELYVDEVLQATSPSSPLGITFDTTTRPDGIMVIRALARDAAGNETSATSSVTVDNVSIKMWLNPTFLNLGKHGHRGNFWSCFRGSVTAHVEGDGLERLLPASKHRLELRVPGGSPVRASRLSVDRRGKWRHKDVAKRLSIEFDRKRLVSSILSGMASGEIDPRYEVPVSLFVDGSRVATAYLRIVSR